MAERSNGESAEAPVPDPWTAAPEHGEQSGRETQPLSTESERHRAAIARALESGGFPDLDPAQRRPPPVWGADAMLADDPEPEDEQPREDVLDADRADLPEPEPADWTSPTWQCDGTEAATSPTTTRPAATDDVIPTNRSTGVAAEHPRFTDTSTGRSGIVETGQVSVAEPAAETAAALPVSAQDPTQADGSVQGYQAGRTLPVRVELARQLGRRRTRLALGFLMLLPLLLLAAFEIGDDGSTPRTGDLAGMATSSGLNFAAFAVSSSAGFLLVLVVALFFGDTVASEASWSSLRYLLAAPVPRGRLLRQKAIVAALLSLLGTVLLPTVALAVGLFWYGPGELATPNGSVLSFAAGAVHLALAVAYLAVQLSWVAGLALWLGVSTDAPLGAVGGALLVSILSQILDQISALGSLRAFLPTHYASAWSDLLAEEVDWTGMANGTCSALIYATVFITLAHWRFHGKDITS
ncbi:hypothetical protein GCM10027271_21860 [Saccharopolyspora gloriosae]|uniref:ABC-type transport system involved in multi-copper enzyme maturation permease subunit n=1 Tax=Saccharopolyspora gloriosae TaxID=455344 RepID=A0A840NLF3_9PSEU|nr:ABC-type transport system involved in multi-copper enzyme maturation permease subunit [Saccharopolyspora gloriosae]